MTADDQRAVVLAFTNGLCAPERSDAGGWGAVLRCGSHARELSGGHLAETSELALEMTAVAEALEALTRPCTVHVYTRASFVISGMAWISGWERRDWTTRDGKPVKHRVLWERIRDASAPHTLRWHQARDYPGQRGRNTRHSGCCSRLPCPRTWGGDMTATITAHVTPAADAAWLAVTVPAIPGLYTQARTLDEVPAAVGDAAATLGVTVVVADVQVLTRH